MTAIEDEPIPYALTVAGWTSARGTMTTSEAAAYVGIHRDYITSAAKCGDLRGVKVSGMWLLDRRTVEAFADRRRAVTSGRLPAEPLLRQIELRGGDYVLGVRIGSAEKRALERARHDGWVTLRTADRLAVRLLGLTPWEVWGPAYG